ncbi:hypothetical protein Tco_0085390 [Tanacetum coccineum]
MLKKCQHKVGEFICFDVEEDLEDPSKQGRKIAEIDEEPDISVVQHDAEVQGRHEHEMEPDFEFTTTAKKITSEERESNSEAEKERLLAELIMRERNTLLNKELKKRATSHLTQAQQSLTFLNISRTNGSHTLKH